MMYLLREGKIIFMDLSIHIGWFATYGNKQPNGTIYQLGGHAW